MRGGLFAALLVPIGAMGCSATAGGEPAGEAGSAGTAGSVTSTGGQPGSGGSGGVAGAELGGAAGLGGEAGTAFSYTCGDGYCDTSINENCVNCAGDCGACETGGAAGGPATGGNGGGGSGSTDRDAAIERAKAGVGFSYWWGHGRFRPEGPTASTAGSCSGSCPSCTHSGSYGGDCSGFVGKVWQVPPDNVDMTDDSHPYSTFDFVDDSSEWTTISQGSMLAADAMVYNNGSAGHIFIYSHGDAWGSMYAYECKGCSAGCTGGYRTVTSSYHAIRKVGY